MMCWRGTRLLALALLGSSWGAGCQAQPPAQPAGRSPFPGLVSTPVDQVESLTRAQKPEPPVVTRSMLELGNTDPGSRETRGVRIRAVVNGVAILEEEVQAAAYQGMVAARTEQEKADIQNAKLNEIIDREVLIQDATARLKNGGERALKELQKAASKEFEKEWLAKLMRANKFTDVEKFKVFMRNNGMPLTLMRRQFERNFIAMQYLRSRIEPAMNKIGHLQIAEYYEKYPADFRVEDNLTWQDIFITAGPPHPSPEAASQFAAALLVRLRKGEDFTRLAREYDNGDSHFRDDSLGVGHKRGEIRPPSLEPKLFSMKEGEVDRIDMEHGFHIVKLTKRQYAGKRPFDGAVQKEIKDKLRQKIFQQEMKRIVADLKRHAIIEVAKEIK